MEDKIIPIFNDAPVFLGICSEKPLSLELITESIKNHDTFNVFIDKINYISFRNGVMTEEVYGRIVDHEKTEFFYGKITPSFIELCTSIPGDKPSIGNIYIGRSTGYGAYYGEVRKPGAVSIDGGAHILNLSLTYLYPLLKFSSPLISEDVFFYLNRYKNN